MNKRLTVNDHLEVLDYVLENTVEQKDYLHVKSFFCTNNDVFPEKDEYFLKMALNKLKKDNYIDFIRIAGNTAIFIDEYQAGEGMSIRRNFNGHIFFKNGGYIGEERRKITASQENKDALERGEGYASGLQIWTEKLANRTAELTRWTKAVAFGAIGLVAWEIFAFVYDHLCK